ncbi:YdcF family protein [Spirulina sp. CS-785/01]|uniref:YdcF family protein n=1 Tax=Spirulina sp. CS-785/01 TaxID=3021716 RepID=UPI00232C661C|nr:YdcF family protein [Spirulina sp. CS-785/01]MDB9312766.1 YdcF family protein [Spirulina sp. CS-785/01]
MVIRLVSSQQKSAPSSTVMGWHLKNRLLLWFMPMVAVMLFTAYKEVQSAIAQPKVAFVLGGLDKREIFAANLAKEHPEIEQVWVSSGSPQVYVEKIFAQAGVSRDRLQLDYEALDTVTNFTSLVDELEASGVKSVYLITSDNHMRRARIVGEIVFGSRGIVIKPLTVPSQSPSESWLKSVRDGARALFWVFTGRTGVSLKERHEFHGLDQ